MDINKVLMEYDNMFGVHSLEEIDEFLTAKIEEAFDEQDYYSALTLMNEMLGFCRDTCQRDKGLYYCDSVEKLFDRLALNDTVEYATSMINVANAYRAFGLYEKSMDAFRTVEIIYRAKLSAGEFNFASLYNNWSLLYQEMEDFVNAEKMLKRALSVVDTHANAAIQQATTRCNLAVTLLRLSREAETETEQGTEQETEEAYYQEAMKYLKESLAMFEADGGRDFHYGAALSAMGDALYIRKHYEEAADYYSRAMKEVLKHTGKTDSYERVEENYRRACHMAERRKREAYLSGADDGKTDDLSAGESDSRFAEKGKNLNRCREFYERYGAKMIHDGFAEYEQRIAVGLVGEGSDCFGFDDDISKDHDYGIGFCMWLTEVDYAKIGITLNQAYERLIREHADEFVALKNEGNVEKMGSIDASNRGEPAVGRYIGERRGVFTIRNFYEKILGVRLDADTENRGGLEPVFSGQIWLQIAEDKLATAVNGMVFRDDAGIFTRIRSALLAYYPENVWLLRLAQKLHDFAQYAQSNYARMMARQDYVTAGLCAAEGMKSAMELAYLLNRTYAPYYKWMRKGMRDLCTLKPLGALLDKLAVTGCQADAWEMDNGKPYIYSAYDINGRDSIVCIFEQIAVLLLEELKLQGIVTGDDTFMDVHCQSLLGRVMEPETGGSKMSENENEINAINADKDMLVDKIVKLEWEQFDKVKNEGGRADCQDDWNTFSIMRKSQYMVWTEELLVSYCNDLADAAANGWNLITEKYARMMKSTAPERYAELEKDLPKRSEERNAIAEEIIGIQVAWMEEFAGKYPKMAGNARSIHTAEDTPYNTSYETYLRGELGTYSETTFVLYGRFIVALNQQGRNLAYDIMENTARLYGYADVDDAEKRLE